MLEADIVARFEAHAGLSALVGKAIYPVEAPPDRAAPYITFFRIDTDPEDANDCASVHTIMLQIEAHAKSYADALAIAVQIRAALLGWRTDPPAAVMSCTYAGEYDEAGDYDEAQRRRRTHCRAIIARALVRA